MVTPLFRECPPLCGISQHYNNRPIAVNWVSCPALDFYPHTHTYMHDTHTLPPPLPLSPTCTHSESGVWRYHAVLLPELGGRWSESGHQVYPGVQHGHNGDGDWGSRTEVPSRHAHADPPVLLCTLRGAHGWRYVQQECVSLASSTCGVSVYMVAVQTMINSNVASYGQCISCCMNAVAFTCGSPK